MPTTEVLPPIASEGTFSFSASIEISVPREKVWNILTDFKGYKHWWVTLTVYSHANR
jgi:uncharacterized protein YndB with AHSA1/START domain